MARRKGDSPQKAALREMMSSFMKDNDVHIKDGNDVNSVMRDMMSIILEGVLDEELDEDLGYSKYVSYKDLKALMVDLKLVYMAPTEEAAREHLEEFGEKWDGKYPKIRKSWTEKWATLSTYFKYPDAVRRLIYTTNTIEGFNRQLRKVTKNKTIFPSDDSLLKMLYLATMDITKKWTGRRRDWPEIRAQLEIYFEERLAEWGY